MFAPVQDNPEPVQYLVVNYQLPHYQKNSGNLVIFYYPVIAW